MFPVSLQHGSELYTSQGTCEGTDRQAVGVLVNLGLLYYFKYLDFTIDNVNRIFHMDFALRNIVLPLGISFYTFQQMSFVIDSYWKKMGAYSFLDYCLFVSFFPQLVAGPIVLHQEI